MLENLRNSIRLFLWSSTKRTEGGRIRITRRYDNFGGTVIDLTWKIRMMDKNGKTIGRKTVQERASKWNLTKVIGRVERDVIPAEVKRLLASRPQNS